MADEAQAGNNTFDDYESNTESWNWYGYPPYPYYPPYGSMTRPPLWTAAQLQAPGASTSNRNEDVSEDEYSDVDSTSTDLTAGLTVPEKGSMPFWP